MSINYSTLQRIAGKFWPILILTVFSTGCQKALDFYNISRNGNGSSGNALPNCRLLSESDTLNGEAYETTYNYNTNGDPIAVKYAMTVLDSSYWNDYTFEWKYDHLGRLRSVTSDWVYSNPQVYYAYEGNSRLPVRDTLYMAFPNVFVEDLTYDSKGRLVKVVKRIIEQWSDDPEVYEDEVYQYYYDLRGNRQENPSNPGYRGLIQYGEGHSIYSLNRAWQIYYKNHSRNAPADAQINVNGLPFKMGYTTYRYECD
jgi:hypothetical protein